MKKNAKPINVDKTIEYKISIDETKLVRTGSDKQYSFFHAILRGYYPQYDKMNRIDREKISLRLINLLKKIITKENWENYGDGILSKISFCSEFEKIARFTFDYFGKISKNYSLIDLNVHIKGKKNRKIFKELTINVETFDVFKLLIDILNESNIFEAINSCKIKSKNIKEFKKSLKDCLQIKIHKKISKSINVQKLTFLYIKLEKFLEILFLESENSSFQNYINSFGTDIEPNMIDLISNEIDRDIYFISSVDGLPFNNNPSLPKNRKSLILLTFPENYYEILGKKLTDDKPFQRQFNFDNPLIKKIRAFVYEPKLLKIYYPELIPYLNGLYKVENSDNSDFENSDFEKSDLEKSDNYYDNSSMDSDFTSVSEK